ncbi:MAG TPA: Mov34/MPN/PAD-1 family protein [Pyrinomonadaceae bacterium]|nr:Mov34/MPN/PAD-1 family protein [Pyrinomonadaceae bacterium]
MPKNDYQFVLELFREDRSSVGRALVSVDWEPAVEWAEFEEMRHGQLPPVFGVTGCAVEPIWQEEVGEPVVKGFCLAFSSKNGRAANPAPLRSQAFDTTYFEASVAAAYAKFRDANVLKAEEKVSYQVLAFVHEEGNQTSEENSIFDTEDVAQTLVLLPSSLSAARSVATKTGELPEELLPAFVPATLLEEIAELSRAAEAKETGGILIGHLHRDEDGAEIFATVTTQIPAQYTEAELMKLTFTSETWTDVRNALQLRRRDEIMLGWWHSHPARAWCKDCSVESQRQCPYARGFLSSHDRGLHRTMFSRAYSLALVVNDVGFAPPSFSLFGWKGGGIVERDFYIVDGGVNAEGESKN